MTVSEWIQMLAPAITSAGGAVVAVKLVYARLREDISDLYTKVQELEDQFVEATLRNARDHGEVQSELGVLKERIENLRTTINNRTTK